VTALQTPMRWPSAWKDPACLDFLRGTAIDSLVLDAGGDFDLIRSRATGQGIHVTAPDGVAVIKGLWPGIRMPRGGAGRIIAGPTGNPWVDSNGWLIRLTLALDPRSAVWVEARPPDNFRASAGAYVLAIADSAAYGGRWIVNLDGQLAASIAAHRAEALDIWKNLTAAAGFFAAHNEWSAYSPAAVVGVISDFAGANEAFSRELLNLLARAGQHYRILPSSAAAHRNAALDLDGLRAVIYADAQAPPPGLSREILAFVNAGGTLIASPGWGAKSGTPAKADDEGPLFSVRSLGKGRIALAKAPASDPYQWANDSVVLVSHRYDMVRVWNGGTTSSYYAVSPDRKKAVSHIMFYSNRGPDAASVRIAGGFRKVRALTAAGPVEKIETEMQKDGIEVHLPQIPQYVALELEA
jgi:hypothetical protein